MIRFIPYKNIDFERWDACITTAINTMPYAYSWYLDAVTDSKWDALVLDNYKAVMPLPYNRKWLGLKQVYHPFYAQQLGVFCDEPLRETQLAAFFQAMPTYIRFYTQINYANTPPLSSNGFVFQSKKNYILSLQNDYKLIRSAYKKGLRSNLKKAQKAQLSIQTITVHSFLAFYEAHPKTANIQMHQQYVVILKSLLPTIIKQQKGVFYGVFDSTKTLCGIFFILENRRRLIYLLARSSTEGRRQAAMPFGIDSIIREYANTDCIFDFEGSEIPSLEKFFRSFGAILQPYYVMHR